MAPGNLYGHLLRDPKADCLLVRPLSHGLSCQTQLVYNYTTRGTCVRKALRHAPSPRGQDPVDEFDRDARVAGALHAAAAAANKDGFHLRVPRLLSAASAPDGSRVSYWCLCNGGTVWSLLERCANTDSVLPMGLALHILLQTLETLDFMYSGLDTPLFHSDLHENNLTLHFSPGSPIPDVHVIDFGRAVHCPPREGDYLASWNPAAATKKRTPTLQFPRWNVPFLLAMVRDRLAPLALPRAGRDRVRAALPPSRAGPGGAGGGGVSRAAMAAVRDDLLRAGKTATARAIAKTMTGCGGYRPLCRAYQMLRELDGEFGERVGEAETGQVSSGAGCRRRRRGRRGRGIRGLFCFGGSSASSAVGEGPAAMEVPSLRPVIKLLRRAVRAAHLDRVEREGSENAAFMAAVLRPVRERAVALGCLPPVLCPSLGGLVDVLEDEGVAGPWDVAEVDGRDPLFWVRGVLARVGEGEVPSGRNEKDEMA